MNKKLAEALEKARKLTEINACQVIYSSQLERKDRELLQRMGWLERLIRGWYLLVRPDIASGDTTPWFSNFWDFLRLYLSRRYGDNYILSAESSLILHTESSLIPQQVVVQVLDGGAGLVTLPFGSSIYSYIDKKQDYKEAELKKGLKALPLQKCLVRISQSYFVRHKEEVCVSLSLLDSITPLVQEVVEGEHKAAADRLSGALQEVGMQKESEQFITLLSRGGMKISPENPFVEKVSLIKRQSSPCASRIYMGWNFYREKILELLEGKKFQKLDRKEYLKSAQEYHQEDAYHSLSIEGYQVSAELIAEVESGEWNPAALSAHQQKRDALAARGYYEAFLSVSQSIERIFSGENSGLVASEELQLWYQSLWNPCVQAGILKYSSTLGYRPGPVYIRGSRHVPPPKEALTDSMEALFQCLKDEENPIVKAILGHFFFVYIHPYTDGNGRISRFLMNVQLASGKIPWCVIKKEKRIDYFESLEQSRIDNDITAFSLFIINNLPMHTERG